MAFLNIEREPVECHGAGDSQLYEAPVVHPDCLILEHNIEHLVMEWWTMHTLQQCLVRDHDLGYPHVGQHVSIYQPYSLDIRVSSSGGGEHLSVCTILTLHLDTVIYPGKLQPHVKRDCEVVIIHLVGEM